MEVGIRESVLARVRQPGWGDACTTIRQSAFILVALLLGLDDAATCRYVPKSVVCSVDVEYGNREKTSSASSMIEER